MTECHFNYFTVVSTPAIIAIFHPASSGLTFFIISSFVKGNFYVKIQVNIWFNYKNEQVIKIIKINFIQRFLSETLA